MPMMAPLMWMNMLIMLTFMLMLTNSTIYFNIIKKINYNKMLLKNFNWKW